MAHGFIGGASPKSVEEDPLTTRYATPVTGMPARGRIHGLRSTYVRGCHCEPCREAERLYRREYRARTRRRAA